MYPFGPLAETIVHDELHDDWCLASCRAEKENIKVYKSSCLATNILSVLIIVPFFPSDTARIARPLVHFLHQERAASRPPSTSTSTSGTG